jgi:hypothetical protein
MVLLLTGAAFGLFSLAAALILQFRVAGWLFLSGLSRMSLERRANVDAVRLSRALSVLFYALAAGFLAGSLLLSMRALAETVIIPAYFLLALGVFDLEWVFLRKYDRNQYPKPVLKAGKHFFVAVNILFFVLMILFVR